MTCCSCTIVPIFGAILIGIYFCIKIYLGWPTKWCRSKRCLVGKTTLITGANTGLGFQTALDFAKRGAKVIIGCRDRSKGEEARAKIIQETDNSNIFVKTVDFSSFDSIRNFAKEINESEDRLDILVNNAGMSFGEDTKTQDGYDVVMQVNYFSHFLLTNLLIKLMKKSGEPSRIVNISSIAANYARNFSVNNINKFEGNAAAYVNSKLCNILFTKELAKRFENTNITTYSLHPGAIKTDIFRYSKGLAKIGLQMAIFLFYKPVEEGAQTTIYCSVERNIEKFNGDHFDNCRRINDYKAATDPGLPRKLWDVTLDIVKLRKDENYL